MPSVSSFLGATLDYAVADRICCHNHVYAEYRGYFESDEVDLFSRLDPNAAETIFYDSVCGVPLFVAPRGRTFDEFRSATEHYGWPSFNTEEIVSENVIVRDDDGGRMESICGTHLGHKLPEDNEDGFYYCIDLVCVAGTPLNNTAAEPNNETKDTSSTEQFSWKLFLPLLSVVSLLLVLY